MVKTVLPMQAMWVPSLVGELRSYMQQGMTKTKKTKRKSKPI